MLIRTPEAEDFPYINEINNQEQNDLKIKDYENRIVDKVVIIDNVVVAYAMLRKIAEGEIIVNYKTSRLDRARAYRELLKEAEYLTKLYNYRALQVFTNEEHIENMLKKKFGFDKVISTCLIKEM